MDHPRRDRACDLTGIDRDSHAHPRRYTAPHVPPTGGRIKLRPEDFVVEEIPLYLPSGTGEHAYLCIRRRSLATLDVVRLLSQHFRVPRKSIGYAGLKDKHAVTTQVFSIRLPHADLDDFPPFQTSRADTLWASRHSNKLRRGHLQGNRFIVRIRDAAPGAEDAARTALDSLGAHGLPARFGPQRFGHLGRNHLMGRALVLGDCTQFLDLLLGPCDDMPDAQADARELYLQGDYSGSGDRFPTALRPERIALYALSRGADARRATLAIGRVERSFYVSAMQSAVFNALLDRRLEAGELDVLREGDVAITHPRRRIIDVDADLLADEHTPHRVRSFELSPSGPMWGRSLKLARAQTALEEVDALRSFGLAPDDFDRSDKGLTGPLDGTRRPFRVPLTDRAVRAGADEHGDFVECAFTLPRGAFATVVLQEVMKDSGAGDDQPTMDE